MNVPLASFGWEAVAAVDIDGTSIGGLVLGLGLLAAIAGLFAQRRARRRAENDAARRVGQVISVMTEADYLLWEAEVELKENDWAWHMHVHPSALARRLFGDHMPTPRTGLWNQFAIGNREEMDRRARHAMEAGEAGYTQEFKASRAGRIFWMHEVVSIAPLGDKRYRVFGLATDVTARHQSDPAQPEGELSTERILEHAQCLLWRATVIQDADGLRWAHFDIPQSQFSDLLFGDRVYSPERGFWENMELPDQTSMDTRSTRAILEGETGYSQQFRVINREGRVFWLNERVSITRVADTIWSLVGVLTDATAQHEAEAARRQSEARLSYLLERADCLVWEATVKLLPGDTLQWSLYTQRSMLYRRIFGERDETELNWHTVKVPEFDQMKGRALEAIKSRSRGYTQEFHVENPGDVIWLREVVTMVEVQPAVFNLVGVVTDITAQHRAEEAQRRSELRLSALLERADCMVWQGEARRVGDREFDWKLFTPKSHLFRRLFGRDPNPEAQLQFSWTAETVPEAEEMNVRAKQAMLSGLPGYEQVFRYHLAGQDIWLNEKVAIKRLGTDQWELVGIITDITPQRGAEAALAAEKERLSVTLRAMSESVITTGVDGIVQFMNPAAAALTGWDEREACGHPVTKICCIENARTAELIDLPVARVARGDVVVELPAQTRLVTRANQRRMIEGCCAPIHAVDSKVIGTVLVFRDVTDQDRLEQELVRATRLESVGVLAGGIAHDFNNILTAVMGNLTLAQLDLASDTPAAESLRSAEKAALRARDLTQQLLTFAKGGEPVRAAVRLDAIVREMTTFALHGSQVRATYDLAPDLWPADADKGQIGRVVQNIVINAVQAMPQGGTLRVAARNDALDEGAVPGLAAGNYIQIAISDTGVGIRPEHVARIFDPYFTTKQTGTGLGLAAVYSIVKKHSGHIDVESQVGQGTTFRLWLPALHGETGGSDSRPPWSPARMTGRVLFMDDEKIIRDLAVTLLKRFGLEVDCAVDGTEAIAKYQEARTAGKPFDLVIMDLTIPGGMGGLAAIGELRGIDPEVKAIVSSGYSSDPVMANYRAHGFVAMIAKPYEVNEFARVLREILTGG
jgi:PAS domain S-box-containing protein